MSKWLNKRRQAAKEALNKNTDHTDIDAAYVAMEAEVDATKAIVDGMVKKLPYFIHPNPAERLKANVTKKQGVAKYKHAIQELIELSQKFGPELDTESAFGKAVKSSGDCFSDLLERQRELDDEVNQQVIDPWKQLLESDFKDLQVHRKKVRSRRLDYDFKRTTNEANVAKGKPEKFPETEVAAAKEKFEQSLSNAENGMGNIIDNDVENISPLKALVDSMRKYHAQSAQRLEELQADLDSLISSAGDRPKRSFKKVSAPEPSASDDEDDSGGGGGGGGGGATPSAKALYDFEPENKGELGFKENDIITLTSRLDENWLEGTVNGKSGMFPSTYVEVIVDL